MVAGFVVWCFISEEEPEREREAEGERAEALALGQRACANEEWTMKLFSERERKSDRKMIFFSYFFSKKQKLALSLQQAKLPLSLNSPFLRLLVAPFPSLYPS